jgi:hypothetical protein
MPFCRCLGGLERGWAKSCREVVREGLKTETFVFRRESGFPVFDIPPDANRISPETIRRFLDDEGYA